MKTPSAEHRASGLPLVASTCPCVVCVLNQSLAVGVWMGLILGAMISSSQPWEVFLELDLPVPSAIFEWPLVARLTPIISGVVGVTLVRAGLILGLGIRCEPGLGTRFSWLLAGFVWIPSLMYVLS